MSANPLRDVRWTLAQALVWVLSRDHALTEQAGAEPVDPMWIAVRCCAVVDAGPASAWRELRGYITAGRIYADGRPGDASGPLANREPLVIEAKDLHLDGERNSPGRECFLSGNAAEQSCWYAVDMMAEDVAALFPSALASLHESKAPDQKGSIPSLWQAVRDADKQIWPDGPPPGFKVESRHDRIIKHLKSQQVDVSISTIRRALA